MTAELTELEKAILDVVIAAGDTELSYDDVASRLGKKRLNPYDVSILTKLADLKLIRRIEKPFGAIRKRYFYRAL